MKEVIRCDECGRVAKMEVRRKWPGKAMKKLVCGYHLRSYKTSEFTRKPIAPPEKPRKKPVGYAPAPVVRGYAPIE